VNIRKVIVDFSSRTRTALILCVLSALAGRGTAAAQTGPDVIPAKRFEVGGGAIWLSGTSLGAATATLTPNQGTGRFTLFDSSERLEGVVGAAAHIAFNITHVWAVEGSFAWSKPTVQTTISGDAENAPAMTFTGETLSQYFLEGGIVGHLTRWTFRGAAVPFLEAGGGYLRQLHEGSALVETGQVFHAGGGLKYVFSSASNRRLKRAGLRGDAKVYVRSGGFEIDSKRRPAVALGGGVFVVF
jgi:hypothetical protein